ncbi:MAG: cytochrome c biogenesis protein ResB [Candidatus Methylacidiphilales bacterium]|nr:cytochrome c biogenesis protein ResB [Candidatus Methylacidiphilales bacterium]
MPFGSLSPAIRRNPVFRFFASLQLALLLLAVLIVASIVGTIYESRLTAEVARAYIYEAWWFNLWLLLLVLNLATVAFSRLPWKKAHTGFLLTHLGIIILLFGAFIGKIFGIEGSITLFEGRDPASSLLINEKQVRFSAGDQPVVRFPVGIIHRLPTPERPLRLGDHAGWKLEAVGATETLQPVFTARPSAEGAPAVRIRLKTAMMNQTLEPWLWLGEADSSVLDLGLARIRLLAGDPPSSSSSVAAKKSAPVAVAVDVVENIFAFAKMPDQQVAKTIQGGSTGMKVRLREEMGRLIIELSRGGDSWSLTAPASEIPKSWPLKGTGLELRAISYWPDFQLRDNKPVTLSNEPNNPAILVELRGRTVPVAVAATDPHSITSSAAAGDGEGPANRLDLYTGFDGKGLRYVLVSRKHGESRGILAPGAPLTTGWADWAFTVEEVLPKASGDTVFRPREANAMTLPGQDAPVPGVLVRLTRGGERIEEWVPQGWVIQSPSKDGLLKLSYGWRTEPLPFGLKLDDFQLERYGGTGNPSEFRSLLRVITPEGSEVTGKCSMNVPMNYPDDWWRGWTGLTWKMSQASWNPENLEQSSIQILRDPGWIFKWLGSLILCTGIFCLFYLRPVRPDLRPPLRNHSDS